MRALVLVLALAAASSQVEAQRKYAVASAIGDRITIVHRLSSTGSNMDRSKRDVIELQGPGLDNAALVAAEDGLKAADKSNEVMLLAPRTPISQRAAAAVRDGTVGQWIAAEARPQLAGMGVTHLVLISRFRADARLEVNGGTTGNGKIEGLGFYIDPLYNPPAESSSEISRGLLASYAYVALRLYDLQGGAQLAERLVLASNSAIPGADKERAWDAMTTEQKVAAIRNLVNVEVARAAAALPPR